MENVILQLKKDFYSQINAIHFQNVQQQVSTLSLLTEEEIRELENMWIELAVWKINHTH